MRKLKILSILFIMMSFLIPNKTLAKTEEIQMLKKTDTEYIIYVENYMKTEFEFAFSNNKNENKQNLKYKTCGKDSENILLANSIIHIDSKTYNQYFLKETYLWVRTLLGEYIIENLKIDLSQAVIQDDINLINNITKAIKVDTKNTITTNTKEDEVEVSKTVGKIDILEDGITYYKLIDLPNNEEYNQLMKLVENFSNNNITKDMYYKLKTIKEFKNLFNQCIPREWQQVQNNEILQPEEATQGKQYILFLKNEKEEGIEKIDAQFLTSTREYNEEYISEKIISKLPKTNDNPILYIIISILFISTVILIILKTISKRKLKKE